MRHPLEQVPQVYERARPGYPPDAVRHLAERLGLREGRRLVDVGAGTGKLTRELVPTGAEVVAVEPVAGMRAVLADSLPDVEVVDGTAEELPLAMDTVDAVVAGQAFHWFDPWMALSEMRRVLRDRGGVGLVWNVRDDQVRWVRRWTELLAPVSDGAPRERLSRWRDALDRTTLFSDPETATFPNPQLVAPEVLLDRVASTSFVAALDVPARRSLLDDFRDLLESDPETRGRTEITVPYRTEVHTFRRLE
jgi:SAM-dependent methyltransferase